ncbi:hypothetical protein SAMN02910456_01448 [Ruminococcaceae bacterium YRB3002]|nr:hypothetical protein SAMN02910456_01448 [Ruminococcaceae bacterium YRB3002]
MITYVCGSMIRYTQFPDEFWKDIDRIIADGGDILLGCADFDHRVYGYCRNKQYENVSVMKGSCNRNRLIPQIESSMPAYISMLRKCDHMIAVWDGESQEAFINILLLLSLHKKCRMYYLPSGKCIEISSVDEFMPYVPEREGWTVNDMEEVLRICGFEEQMINYLLDKGVFPETLITEIISRAPVSLNKKREMLENLQKKNNLNYEAFCKVSSLIENGSDMELVKMTIQDMFAFGSFISKAISDINWAKYWLNNGVYYLFIEWYDTDVFYEKSYPIGLFRSLRNVMKCIEHEDNYDRDDSDEESPVDWWYRLEVWTDEGGDWGSEAAHEFNYYIYKSEVCWFERLLAYKEDEVVSFRPDNKDFFAGRLDLNLSTPFKPGDIVNIDCTPFGPPFHALIIEGRDQFDCCMPQVLFKMPYTDRWAISSLKHKNFYKDIELSWYEPPLSPLYRLRAVREDELTEDDKVLVRISKDLAGSEEKGFEFWRAFEAKTDGLSDEEVIEIWDKSH